MSSSHEPATAVASAHIERGLMDEIDRLAHLLGASRSMIIRECLTRGLAEFKGDASLDASYGFLTRLANDFGADARITVEYVENEDPNSTDADGAVGTIAGASASAPVTVSATHLREGVTLWLDDPTPDSPVSLRLGVVEPVHGAGLVVPLVALERRLKGRARENGGAA